ncbi:MAG: hypothetical protein F4Y03_03990 [Alphaproteobacteria bacterium]|nr:hypothetical protein [Alphaproteobacteria bacterium]
MTGYVATRRIDTGDRVFEAGDPVCGDDLADIGTAALERLVDRGALVIAPEDALPGDDSHPPGESPAGRLVGALDEMDETEMAVAAAVIARAPATATQLGLLGLAVQEILEQPDASQEAGQKQDAGTESPPPDGGDGAAEKDGGDRTVRIRGAVATLREVGRPDDFTSGGPEDGNVTVAAIEAATKLDVTAAERDDAEAWWQDTHGKGAGA